MKDRSTGGKRRGRMPISNKAKSIDNDHSLETKEQFLALIDMALEYRRFVQKTIEDLENSEFQAFLSTASNWGNRVDILDDCLHDLKRYEHRLEEMQADIEKGGFKPEYPDQYNDEVGNAARIANRVILIYSDIGPRGMRHVAEVNCMFIEKIAAAFTKLLNRLKNYLGFPAGRQHDIVNDLQDMTAEAQYKLRTSLRGGGEMV